MVSAMGEAKSGKGAGNFILLDQELKARLQLHWRACVGKLMVHVVGGHGGMSALAGCTGMHAYVLTQVGTLGKHASMYTYVHVQIYILSEIHANTQIAAYPHV